MVEPDFTIDSLYEKSEVTIESLELCDRVLKITFTSKTESRLVCEYPIEWLRLCCQCSQCFSFITQSYNIIVDDVLFNETVVKSYHVSSQEAGGSSIVITWSDDHESQFKSDWLFIRRFTEDARKERLNKIYKYPFQYELWGENFKPAIGSYEEVTCTDEGYKLFAMSLIKDGVFIAQNSPDREIADEFMNKLNLYIYHTHYGSTWKVVSEDKPENVAYTSGKLGLHNDLVNLSNTPNIQFLHCIKQSIRGGENMLADGIKAAQLLKQRHVEDYKILTRVQLEHEDVLAHPGQAGWYIANHKPVIRTDENGDPLFICWNYFTRSSHFLAGDAEMFQNWLEAFKRFYKILTAECQIKLKTKDGEILCFDNRRILHSRESYDSAESRYLEGWYADWDYFTSKLRVIAAKENQAKI